MKKGIIWAVSIIVILVVICLGAQYLYKDTSSDAQYFDEADDIVTPDSFDENITFLSKVNESGNMVYKYIFSDAVSDTDKIVNDYIDEISANVSYDAETDGNVITLCKGDKTVAEISTGSDDDTGSYIVMIFPQ